MKTLTKYYFLIFEDFLISEVDRSPLNHPPKAFATNHIFPDMSADIFVHFLYWEAWEAWVGISRIYWVVDECGALPKALLYGAHARRVHLARRYVC